MLFGSLGPVKPEISLKMTVTGHAVPGTEQQAEMFGEIAVTPEVERRVSAVIVRVLSLYKEFPAEGEVRTQVAL